MNLDAAETFDRLADRYYRSWFRFHPEAAVDAGVPGYEHLLRPFDDDDIGALIALNTKLLAALDELDQNRLDPDRAIDFQLLYGSAVIEHHDLLERDWRHRDPAGFLPLNALYQLTVRPVADPVRALRSRLARVPDCLRGARSHLSSAPQRIPPVWLENAIAEASSGAEFVRGLAQFSVPGSTAGGAKLAGPCEKAARALEDFSRYLETDLAPRAAGEFAVGREHYVRLLRHRHFLDVEPEALRAFGHRLLGAINDELRDVTRALRGDDDVAALAAAIQADHPAADRLLDEYRTQMGAARQFVQNHDLVTMPERESLAVVETPSFLRHRIPFAAYLDPSPADAKQQGLYYVSPAVTEELLGEHNRPGLMHTCVHEAWPGHHLQFVTANLKPTSRTLARLNNPSATLYEGWALYCEQLMHEQGFLDRPEQRFLLLRDRLWRALRIVLDVELQTQGLSIADAATRMEKALGFPRQQAMADLAWYSQAPTVPMGYAVGWSLINALRAHQRVAESGPALKAFHDRLLGAGSMALALVVRRQFGAHAWDAVRAGVFGKNDA